MERPRTRGECLDGTRPCPWVSCRHHLFLDVSAKTGHVWLNFPEDVEPGDMTESCSLDVADAGEHMALDVGPLMGVTRARAYQIERETLAKPRVRLLMAEG
jgi:hypothetical protein